MDYKFTLSSDSTCDLYHDFIVENDIKHVSLTFTVEGKDGTMQDRLDNFTCYQQYVDFYNELRGGAFSRTSMLNYEAHYNHFLKLAKEGAEDVVHFTISSGLSPTKDVAAKAAADVKADYPKFNVYVVDPLTATVGQGALVQIALKCRNEGKTAKETHELCTSLRLHIQHYIVADDLTYLKKGGRVSAAAAAFGTMLNIKPILTFDKEGKLYPLAKVKGSKKAISFIKDKLRTEGPDPDYNYLFIVHTDNEGPAKELEEFVRSEFGIEPHVSIMGPVIGSHVGPGAFALGYLSKSERNEF
ncbi:MAG: DegV family protein [Clostridiales bacterium]|nr:DegV family protein [Clostridiales bacterium]